MCHGLILGMTESGKTTVAMRLALNYRAKGIGVLVYDPMNDPRWACDYITSDIDEFQKTFWASKGCAVFIDEAGDVVGQHDKDMQMTATKGRHWGHKCHYISQRGTMINRTVRDQCSHIFLFATAREDVKVHALEWNAPQLLQAADFKQGDYFHKSRFGQISQSNIFTGVKKDATTSENSYDGTGAGNNGDSDNSETVKTRKRKTARNTKFTA